MSTFVDYAGLNTLVSSSFDDTNTITSGRNETYLAAGISIPVEQEYEIVILLFITTQSQQ